MLRFAVKGMLSQLWFALPVCLLAMGQQAPEGTRLKVICLWATFGAAEGIIKFIGVARRATSRPAAVSYTLGAAALWFACLCLAMARYSGSTINTVGSAVALSALGTGSVLVIGPWFLPRHLRPRSYQAAVPGGPDR